MADWTNIFRGFPIGFYSNFEMYNSASWSICLAKIAVGYPSEKVTDILFGGGEILPHRRSNQFTTSQWSMFQYLDEFTNTKDFRFFKGKSWNTEHLFFVFLSINFAQEFPVQKYEVTSWLGFLIKCKFPKTESDK